MNIETSALTYSDGEIEFRGQVAFDASAGEPRPGVLIAHTWAGCGGFERRKAVQLAGLGYVALAIDMYGGGIVGSGPDENERLMKPLIQDRDLLQRRMLAALAALKDFEAVDGSRTAAIGYCFGGLCVLDLARTGAEFQAAVSFHGILKPPESVAAKEIRAKVLVLHGWDDPMAKPDEVNGLAAELSRGGADWQIHAYGGTVHAFTNPAANNPTRGTVYNATADRRSWASMLDFLAESFGERTP